MSDRTLTWYVSTTGSDQWSGAHPEPTPDGRGPFATLRRAQREIRAVRARGQAARIRVVIREGTYALDEPLVLTPEDSGTAEAPVVFCAYPGEAPVLSGGRRIAGWETATVNGRSCWTAPLQGTEAANLRFTQLFVNGQRRWRPRMPETGFYRFAGLPESAGSFGGFYKGPDRACYRPGDIRQWKHLDDVELVVLQLWFDTHHRIRSIDPETQEVAFAGASIGSLHDEKGDMARYYVENVFEALKEPGQWYHDRTEDRLYYIPHPGEDPATADVVVPVLETLVHFKGSRRRPVANVRLENLAFRHAEWRPPADYVGSVQAAYDVPGAVVLEHAADCVLYRCEVAQVSQYGIQVATGSFRNRIVACAIHDLGAGGVRIDHEWLERVNLTNPRNLRRQDAGPPSETTISDCSIHDASLIYLSAIGIWVGNAGFNRIRRNHIFNLNYTGISSGWTWGYDDTATVDNRIEHNHIHHINWNRLLSDNGGIYTLGQAPGCVVRGNHIHHVDCYAYGGWGIYHDEGTMGQRVENNVVHHTRGAGFFTHYGRDNTIRNNIFALAQTSHIGPGSRKERYRATVFERNIVYWREGSPGAGSNAMTNWDPRCYTIRNNLLWCGGRELDFGAGATLADWQHKGQFLDTLVADPLFADPDAGDFSLRADSPARTIGFRPFRLRAGVRIGGAQRPASFDDWPEESMAERPASMGVLDFVDERTCRYTFSNPGRVPISGRVRFRAGPRGAVRIAPGTILEVEELAPCETRRLDIPLEIDPEARWFFVEGIGSGKGVCSTYLHRTIGDVVVLPELGPVPGAEDVAEAMRDVPWRGIAGTMGNEVACVKCALSGHALLVHVRVVDRDVRPMPSQPWSGSCVELFVTPSNGGPEKPELCHAFLIPAADRMTLLTGRRMAGAPQPDPRIRGVCRPWDDQGYEAGAILPLDVAGIPESFVQFFLEMGINADLGGAVGHGKRLLFGAPAPFSSTEGCARIRRA